MFALRPAGLFASVSVIESDQRLEEIGHALRQFPTLRRGEQRKLHRDLAGASGDGGLDEIVRLREYHAEDLDSVGWDGNRDLRP